LIEASTLDKKGLDDNLTDDCLANVKCKLIRRKIPDRNVVYVWIGTNAPKDERQNAGIPDRELAETVLQIESFNVIPFPMRWQVTVQGGRKISEHTTQAPSRVLIKLFGDSEAVTFIRALRTALELLEEEYASHKRRLNSDRGDSS